MNLEKELIFLVVLDDSEEMFDAMRYAAQRCSRTNGRVALLYTFDKLEFSHWKAVEDIAEVESREQEEGPPEGKPINIELTSNDYKILIKRKKLCSVIF